MRTLVIDIAEGQRKAVPEHVALVLRRARKAVAFTGAGISVESGIPDFRSKGGLWTVYAPEEYATMSAFLSAPRKAWKLFRAMGEVIAPARPNAAHAALARLEQEGLLAGVITQNIDGLHRAAGSRRVVEVHGDYESLHCVFCGRLDPLGPALNDGDEVPLCRDCGRPLKPNVVLFEEGVRGLDEVEDLLEGCDLVMVIGTSAQVYPAAAIPGAVKRSGGQVWEFNLEETELTLGGGFPLFSGGGPQAVTDVFFRGPAGVTLPALLEEVLIR